MPVIAAGVVNKEGRIILLRSFNDISRIRVEGLLSAFPRMLESSINKQVTYIDAGSVRYVYQPLEELFLVLITTKGSNIVEDLATLHLMGRLIPEYVDTISESTLESKAFQIFFALDEVIVGGKRESTTVDQIKTYLGMESHEEMMAREEKRMQMEKAKKDAARKAHELRDKRRKGLNPYGGNASDDPCYAGFGSGEVSGMSGITGIGGMGHAIVRDGIGPGVPSIAMSESAALPAQQQQPAARVGGMNLGRAKKTDITAKVLRESGLPTASAPASPAQAAAAPLIGADDYTQARGGAGGDMEGVHIVVEEKISAQLVRDGGTGTADIRGELSVLVTDPQLAKVKFTLAPVSSEFSFRAHAKINKDMFANDRVLAMKDNKPFPLQQPVTILRWRLVEPGSVRAPITLTCWPSSGSITVEYELSNTGINALRDVRIAIPLYGATAEDVEASVGVCDATGGFVVWSIPVIDAHNNTSGNVEVTLADGNVPSNVFFPVDISFSSLTSVGMVRVVETVEADSGMPVRFGQETNLSTDGYSVP